MISTPATTPILGLRMRSNRSSPPKDCLEQSDLVDRISAMLQQEQSEYNCRDYLKRRQEEKENAMMIDSTDEDDGEEVVNDCDDVVIDTVSSEEGEDDGEDEEDDDSAPGGNNVVDAVCREKMCEWSYRVCDHFHTGREIVAISFSYLDRFIDKCNCDRTAFKLAAMTTLYLATKIYNARQLSISSLAELSRGEFEISHIAEMETIILQTLNWRLHPPTTQCFINALYNYLPVQSSPVAAAIYQRALFFAELSLYDYTFVTKERSLLAVASIINAMEGMDGSFVSLNHQAQFLEKINETFGLNYTFDSIESIRNRLWYVYSMSAQYKEDGAITMHTVNEVPSKHSMGVSSSSVVEQSPVSVAVSNK